MIPPSARHFLQVILAAARLLHTNTQLTVFKRALNLVPSEGKYHIFTQTLHTMCCLTPGENSDLETSGFDMAGTVRVHRRAPVGAGGGTLRSTLTHLGLGSNLEQRASEVAATEAQSAAHQLERHLEIEGIAKEEEINELWDLLCFASSRLSFKY